MRNYLVEQGLTSVEVTKGDNKYFKPYEHGVVQPGVLCVRPDASVVYSWAVVPNKVSR